MEGKHREFECYLNKTIGIKTKDRFYFQGKVLSVSELFITIRDRKLGIIKIAYDDIKRMMEETEE